MHSKRHNCAVGYALLALPSLCASQASGQTVPSASQTPPGEQVDRRSTDAQLSLKIGGVLSPPAGAERVVLNLDTVTLNGGFEPVSEKTRQLLPKAGAQITLADVYRVAGAIQQAYFDAGYPLVRVFVPVQDLDRARARVTITILSGYVGRVDLDALHPRVRAIVRRYLAKLVDRRPLTAGQLERAVLLAGDVAGVTLASALMPGQHTGETILVASGEFRPVQGVLSVDNRLSPELGREQLTGSFAFNGLLGLGERIGITAATAADDVSFSRLALRRYGGVSLDLPVGDDGMVVGFDGAVSTSRPTGAAASLALYSKYVHGGATLSYPLVRTRAVKVVTTGSFDRNRETQQSLLLGFGVPLSRDETSVARLAMTGSYAPTSRLFGAVSIEYSRGLDLLGARTRRDATVLEPLSRIGADATFDKMVGDLTLNGQILKTPLVASVHVRGQSSFGKPLLRSEQLSVTAPDLVSGPPSGRIVGDNGYAVRYQIDAPTQGVAAQVAPYVFAAAALTRLERPTSFELGRTTVTAFGAGARVAVKLVKGFTLSGSVEYSRTHSNDRSVQGNWVTFQTAVRF